MEFILQSVEGVPDGSVLSIKIGDTKRQGPTGKLGQPFRFASSPAEPLPMKVEILTPAAPSQSVKVDPSKTVQEVQFSDKMKVTLAQREAPELRRPLADVKDVTASQLLATDKLETAQSAAAYLERHDLVRTFQDILHGLLVIKPADPFAYLEDHVARAKALFTQKAATATVDTTKVESGESTTTPARNTKQKGSIVSRSKVDALLDILQKTNKNLPLVMPFLPKSLSDVLVSKQLADECQAQFGLLDKTNSGKLGPEELIPVIVQLSTANKSAVSLEQCTRFIKIFDANEDGVIQLMEFTTLTQFVIIAAHLESPDGQKLLEQVQLEDSKFREFLEMLENDKDRINDVVPFLPDWLVAHLTSDSFMYDCNARFDVLDKDKSGVLEPLELVPVVMELTKANPLSVDVEKCKKFVKVFDVHQNGVIMRDEFIDFAQFLAVMNFLSNTVEGQSVAQASMEFADRLHWEAYMEQLKEEGKVSQDIINILPKAMVDDITSGSFSRHCKERFMTLDQQRQGVLDPTLLFPLISQLCAEHPIHLDESRYRSFFTYFDKQKRGVVSHQQVVEFAKFVVVIAYLRCCWEWHDVSHNKQQIEELLSFLKLHCEKIDDILPYLPADLKDELTSPDFESQCMEDFKLLDKAKTGVLEPKEVIPLILQLSSAHHMALTTDHVMEFVDLFDTGRNGVITPMEYVNFSRFMMILAYLETEEGQAVKEAADISAGARRVDELLAMLRQDRGAIHKVIPILPEEVFNDVTGDAFILQCEEKFAALDVDRSGVLEPKELFPVVVELSEAHPYAIDIEHCRQFTQIFDVHGDGVIRSDEFVDFTRFLCVMSYLHSEEGQKKANDALKIMAGSQRIEQLLVVLQRDRHELRKVIPYLPEALRDEIISQKFADNCRARYIELDKNKKGFLGPAELIPTILDMTGAHHLAIDENQCRRFIAIFDDEKTGVISLSEYVNFARFIMVMSYLQTEDGKVVLDLAVDAQRRQQNREADLQIMPAPQVVTQAPNRSMANADASHMQVDLEFHQNRLDKLTEENTRLQKDMFVVQETLRLVVNRVEEQDKLLRHVEVDLQNSRQR
mmetsp:Transcript_67218/g.105055  ORF Transcript_67218/g.105055 Transcript_67218/m.105055 type:complete len:1078 (-) Transcript_67218:41-3274(-)